MSKSIVFMGVAGCGKSTLAAAVAHEMGLPMVEGDTHHSDSNRDKMSRGIPLTEEDRAGWLNTLGDELRNSPMGVVLTCSALKRKYRDGLRQATPDLHFVFLDISRAAARDRVAARTSHFFSETLVDSQFAALEPPVDEAYVLRVDATADLNFLTQQVIEWLS